jgi:hypothetical protein
LGFDFSFITHSLCKNVLCDERRTYFTISGIKHHWYEYQDLTARDIKKELLTNPKFQGIDLIYPDIPLEVALGGNQKKKDKQKPRNLQPNTAYFENQGAATSQF